MAIVTSSWFSVCFRGISQLGSAFKLAHIYIQAISLHKDEAVESISKYFK